MKILTNKVNTIVKYGRIKIETRIGILEYSYQVGADFDDGYQLESTLTRYHELMETELDQIDDLITKEMKK